MLGGGLGSPGLRANFGTGRRTSIQEPPKTCPAPPTNLQGLPAPPRLLQDLAQVPRPSASQTTLQNLCTSPVFRFISELDGQVSKAVPVKSGTRFEWVISYSKAVEFTAHLPRFGGLPVPNTSTLLGEPPDPQALSHSRNPALKFLG